MRINDVKALSLCRTQLCKYMDDLKEATACSAEDYSDAEDTDITAPYNYSLWFASQLFCLPDPSASRTPKSPKAPSSPSSEFFA
jgi:hypothetical protein